MIAGFFERWKPSIFKGAKSVSEGAPVPPAEGVPAVRRLYTVRDAGAVYDKLRELHPEMADYWLLVQVVPANELRTPTDQREVARRRLKLGPLQGSAGLHPLSRIAWKGERPQIAERPGVAPLELVQREEGEADVAAIETVLDVFGGPRHEWTPSSEPLTSLLPA